MDRETLLWALVFSVPPGVGIVGFATYVIADGVLEPLAVVAGAATTLVIFSVIAFAGVTGSEDETRENEIGL